MAPAQRARAGREGLGDRPAASPGFTAANICWWYAMGASTDVTVTPRPIYHADGRKSPDAYVRPPALHDELTGALGEFPLFQYWGPTASIASTRVDRRGDPPGPARATRSDLVMAYLPHLDYDLQRFGPDSPAGRPRGGRTRRAPWRRCSTTPQAAGATVDRGRRSTASQSADRPVDLNRVLRREGLLEVYVQQGREQLDPWTSRAFAVADHQVAHVYVRRPGGRPHACATCCWACPASTRCSTGTRRPGTGSTMNGRANSSWSPSPAPGSPTTTGSTTTAHPSSRAASTSTASPGTTRRSSSSTRPTALAKAKAGLGPRAQEARPPLRDERRAARPVVGARHARPAAVLGGRHPAAAVLGCRAAVLGRRRRRGARRGGPRPGAAGGRGRAGAAGVGATIGAS